VRALLVSVPIGRLAVVAGLAALVDTAGRVAAAGDEYGKQGDDQDRIAGDTHAPIVANGIDQELWPV
jgi:hypothetical protein